ncbi:aminoglycoside 6'-N-acetyltransferase/aminoglycoside 6'-N-acetyltransferase-1b [Marininema mesophilum]|uniref:Aminoglycoside 6'-N-acetyltransferase/aminoglycoside 6'-N-acetyltransferase-1b n=2 Tax=Marininema mesophilum TaxID=1048340 RepID=A0A1H2VEN2_9BACL|nr:aminoglycoside 6'-N-acetyltransferase/aminoglycoside 6'-N-acetyltransferase-1b [Marininema mesophilum]
MSIQDFFIFNCLEEKDLPLLHRWFQEPHVKKWWPVPKEKEDFFDSYLKRIHSTEISLYFVSYGNIPIGFLQAYPVDRSKETWLPKLPKNTIGIDQFIGEIDFVGKGYGTSFIKKFIDQLLAENNEMTVILDPDPRNKAAIRCYEKVGFVRVGIFPRKGDLALLMRYN